MFKCSKAFKYKQKISSMFIYTERTNSDTVLYQFYQGCDEIYYEKHLKK